MDFIWEEGEGWWECFLLTNILPGSQKQLHNSQVPARNENVGPLVQKVLGGASLVAQWLGVRLPMQGTRVRALVREDPTCHGAAGPVSHGR